VDEHPRVPVGERREALGPPLVLGHDRGTKPEPVERGGDDAQREDLRERRFRFDAQESAELPLG
jgi:hypothetical protein